MEKQPEPWLRGVKTPGLNPCLQPVVDAWAGVVIDLKTHLKGFDNQWLWEKPAGCASVGFHLMHMAGVIDRLLTYASKQSLSEQQFAYLRSEGVEKDGLSWEILLSRLQDQMAKATEQLVGLSGEDLGEARSVGRAGLPSTIIGLCMHSAEHITRHAGQVIVTARVLKARRGGLSDGL